MMTRPVSYSAIIWLVAGYLVTGGCASIEKESTLNTEHILKASGFSSFPADTPERVTHLTALTQRKLAPHERDGETFYVFADSTYCKCLLIGDEKAYETYRNLLVQQYTEQVNEDASMDWGLWGIPVPLN